MHAPGTFIVHNKGFIGTIEQSVGPGEYIVRSRKDGSRIVCSERDFHVAEAGTAQVPSGVTLKSAEPVKEESDASQQSGAAGSVADTAGAAGDDASINSTS